MYSELEGLDDDDGKYQLQKAVVQVAEEAVDEADINHETAAAALRKASAKVSRMEGLKSHGRAHQGVWMSIENRLKELKVYSSAYHGGDLEGNQCRQLMKESLTIMAVVKEIVTEYLNGLPTGERSNKLADEGEVALFTNGFCRLFQYFDVVSHFCYQPFGSLSDSDLAKLQVAVDRLVDLYLKILPTCPMKLHMIAVHLVPHVRQFRGLKSHHESHIERAHQQGVRDSRRLGVLGSFAKKTISALKTEATANKPEVLAMVRDTNQKKIKRPGRKRKAAALEEQRATDGGSRLDYLNGILELPAIVEEFPSLLELAKESFLKDQDEPDE
jgi:hypothetical protein